MPCGLPSFRISVAGNQVAVHKSRWFGDPVITVYVRARSHHSHCCCCFLWQAGDLQKEALVVGRDGIHQPVTHPSAASLLLAIRRLAVICHTCVLCMCHGCRQSQGQSFARRLEGFAIGRSNFITSSYSIL